MNDKSNPPIQTEHNEKPKRGKLKIFLGAVAGVGKTCTMLSEAHRRKQRGEDIVIGIIVTHGRKETEKLTAGLEQIPLKKIEYRDQIFEELDTNAVINRKPQTVLIDEMAHTNIPGTVHPKRWQSVEEILDAGINVLSTLNVQHIESLNDKVFEITGVRVREIIPDSVVESADEIVLVDVTPSALINRLKRGDVYAEDKIPQALENFFKMENIGGLRELALRITADEVDCDLQDYCRKNLDDRSIKATERLALFIKLEDESIKLIRRAYRISRRLDAEFFVVHIKYPGENLNPANEERLNNFIKLAEDLGAEFILLEGTSIPDEIVNFSNRKQLTVIAIGRSNRSIVGRLFKKSITTELIKRADKADILVIKI